MEFSKLPEVRKDKIFVLEHFPDRFHAAVFRLWETVEVKRIATALGTSVGVVKQAAEDMGLPRQRYNQKWADRGYITTIRNAWHILPYEQLLLLLGWDEDKLATILEEDDFLKTKLGKFKPYCEHVAPGIISEKQKGQLAEIKNTVKQYFDGLFEGAKPFDFFDETVDFGELSQPDNLRMIYSYCGLYAGVLDNDISMSYPEELLKMYKSAGINAIWLPVVLYQMIPFTFDEGYSKGWEQRQKRLVELINLADKYGIKVYLYLNEPRCMPIEFFNSHPDLKGHEHSVYAALCTQKPQVMDYLKYAVRKLCKSAPGLGGFFVITCSENLTHCKSKTKETQCPHCKDIPVYRLVADVLCAISGEAKSIDPSIRTIAWTWAWDAFMTKEEMFKCIDLLPEDIIIQSNSEAKKEFCIGGVKGNISDYSMSIPGPAPLAEDIWKYAKSKGHEVCAKVQVNDTWECSTVPFLPVFDLIREHMMGLRRTGVKHMMLSWTLGGYPSVNLKVASSCLDNPDEDVYTELLRQEYGQYADKVKAAATVFSDAFREFPFYLGTLYFGPQNAGPSNLLYNKPSGFDATMTCYSYDDLDKWRGIYPEEVYIDQLNKLSTKWKKGLDLIDDMPDCLFKQAAWGGYALFYSSYLQGEFIRKRQSNDAKTLLHIIDEEQKMALLMYDLMQKSSLFGYEAANHYYFNKGMLAEKVINCNHLKKHFSKQ